MTILKDLPNAFKSTVNIKDVHAYCYPLGNEERLKKDISDIFVHCLSKEDWLASDKYRFPIIKKQVLATKALSKYFVAKFTNNENIAALRFQRTPAGKPYIADVPVNFSWSHCRSMFVIVLSTTKELGVDVEAKQQYCTYNDLIPNLLSPNEKLAYEHAKDAEKEAVFLNFWTRKEAFLKAKGTGISTIDELKKLDTSDYLRSAFEANNARYQCAKIDIDNIHIAHIVATDTQNRLIDYGSNV